MGIQNIEKIKTEWIWMIRESVREYGFQYCMMNENNRHEFDDNYQCYHCGADYDYVVEVVS
jgi:hypothetical protein